MSQGARAYPSFWSMKWLEVFLLPPPPSSVGDASPSLNHEVTVSLTNMYMYMYVIQQTNADPVIIIPQRHIVWDGR